MRWSIVLRIISLVAAVCLLLVACGDGSSGDAEAAGLYLLSTDSILDADAKFTQITKPSGTEPSTKAGFRVGIRAFALVLARDGVIGVRIAFTEESTLGFVDELVAEAKSLDLDVQVVLVGQLWPDCVGEPDCDRAEIL